MKSIKVFAVAQLVLIFLFLPNIVNGASINLVTQNTREENAFMEFLDVKRGDWYYEDVMLLSNQKIVSGYTDQSFKPQENVGVDAYIKMIMGSLGYYAENGSPYWAEPIINLAIEVGIIEPKMFIDYRRPITRGEMARITAAALTILEPLPMYGEYAFQLSDIKGFAESERDAILIAMAKGIITGYSDFSFKPTITATRAEAVTMIARVVEPKRRKFVNFFDEIQKQLVNDEKALYKRESTYFIEIDRVLDEFLGEDNKNGDSHQIDQSALLFSKQLDEWINQGINSESIWVVDKYVIYELVVDNLLYYFQKNQRDDSYIIEVKDIDTGNGSRFTSVYKLADFEFYLQEVRDEAVQGFGVSYTENEVFYYDEIIGTQVLRVGEGYRQIVNTKSNTGNGYVYINQSNEYDYVGVMTRNKYIGNGRLTEADGTQYIGYFDNFSLNSEGVLNYENGTVFEDEFVDLIPLAQKGKVGRIEEGSTVFESKIDEIISLTTEDRTNNDKIKRVHDQIVLKVTYATDTVVNSLADLNYNNPYAALVDGYSVCLGYAQALNIILNRLGIESYVVIGDTDGDGIDDHAWNYIAFDEGYFHVDATWNDPDLGTRIDYDYYKIEGGQLLNERTISKIIGF